MHGVQVRCPSPSATWEQFVWRLRRGCVQCRAGKVTALINRTTASKAGDFCMADMAYIMKPV